MMSQRRTHSSKLFAIFALISLAIFLCAPRQVWAIRMAPPRPQSTIQGLATYDFRTLTPQGYSRAVETRPARFVTVIARDARGTNLAQTMTDAQGRFSITTAVRPASVALRSSVNYIRTPAVSTAPTMHIDVAPDRDGRTPYEVVAPVSANGAPIQLHATLAEPRGEGGAFHILDTLVTAMQTVYQWSQRELPPFFVIWSHASGTDWSYYRGERPEHSNRYALELMGGVRGRLETTDADQHDIYIVLHEFGHFVFDQLSSDSSIAGFHPATVNTDPGVAWEEGRATWFACAVLGDSVYRDAVGIEPTGSLRQNDDLENLPNDALRGFGSQRTVEEILWDLSDGTLAPAAATPASTTLPDRDNDGIALGPAQVFRSMMTLRDNHETLPGLVTFLRTLAQQQHVTEPQIERLLQSPRNQNMTYTRLGTDEPWPFLMRFAPAPGAGSSVTATVRGKIDGVSDPAPSGGRANPNNGFDAVRSYRVIVTTRSMLEGRLTIRGTGRAADHSDVDLELRDGRANMLDHSTSETPSETISRVVDPGLYVFYVRDGGSGNAANFELSVSLSRRTR